MAPEETEKGGLGMEDYRNRIQQLSIDACVRLFEDYGLDMRHVAPVLPSAWDMVYCGIVGFSGENIRGGLVLAGSREALGASNPVQSAGIRDWVAELANQLAGRVKSRLLAHDVELHIATPVVLRGEHLALEARGPVTPQWFHSSRSSERVCLWMDVDLAPAFTMSATPDASKAGLDEGTSLMF
jgi:hypothetical protein